MAKQKVEIEVDLPEGYEATGEFRPPIDGEVFLDANNHSTQARMNFATQKLILRRVKTYREPVLPADAGKKVEFSDDETNWRQRKLSHWKGGWYDEYSARWKYCRIEKEST